jgi:hypothetical protein
MLLNFRKKNKSVTITPKEEVNRETSDPSSSTKIETARQGIDKYRNALIELAK